MYNQMDGPLFLVDGGGEAPREDSLSVWATFKLSTPSCQARERLTGGGVGGSQQGTWASRQVWGRRLKTSLQPKITLIEIYKSQKSEHHDHCLSQRGVNRYKLISKHYDLCAMICWLNIYKIMLRYLHSPKCLCTCLWHLVLFS